MLKTQKRSSRQDWQGREREKDYNQLLLSCPALTDPARPADTFPVQLLLLGMWASLARLLSLLVLPPRPPPSLPSQAAQLLLFTLPLGDPSFAEIPKRQNLLPSLSLSFLEGQPLGYLLSQAASLTNQVSPAGRSCSGKLL